MAREGMLYIRVDEVVKARLVGAAAKAGVSLSAWMLQAAEEKATAAEVAAAPVVPPTGRAERPPVVRAETTGEDDNIAAVIEGRAGAAFDGEVIGGTFGAVAVPASDWDPPAVVGRAVPPTPEERAAQAERAVCTCGARSPTSARFGGTHLAWCPARPEPMTTDEAARVLTGTKPPDSSSK